MNLNEVVRWAVKNVDNFLNNKPEYCQGQIGID